MVLSSLFLFSTLFMKYSLASTISLQAARPSVDSLHKIKVYYFTEVVLGGKTTTVAIDTARSDFWINSVRETSSGPNKTVTYGDEKLSGPVKTAELSFSAYEINNQSYIEANSSKLPGMMGFSPEGGPLEHILSQSSATYITLMLQRNEHVNVTTRSQEVLAESKDMHVIFPADITISSVLAGYEDITKQPKLTMKRNDGRFAFVLNEDSIIAPSGDVVGDGQLNFALDPSAALNHVPKDTSNAFYKDFPGSEFITVGTSDVWVLPCDQEVNLTMQFQGKSIPIHALVLSLPCNRLAHSCTRTTEILGISSFNTSNGYPACIGSFQPINATAEATVDIILGAPFLHNVYTLLNFGIDSQSDADSYLQFLPLTDRAQAHTAFVSVRGKADHQKTPVWKKVLIIGIPVLAFLGICAAIAGFLAVGALVERLVHDWRNKSKRAYTPVRYFASPSQKEDDEEKLIGGSS